MRTDTISKPEHSPHKATIYSAILPGLGQAYNKKYWKVPIVYSGFGFLTYQIYTNNTEYVKYKEAYVYDPDIDPVAPNEYATKYDKGQLLKGRDFYRKKFERSLIYTALWYFINIIDASVDAHLFNFDISENLSLRVEPTLNFNQYISPKPIAGLKICISIP